MVNDKANEAEITELGRLVKGMREAYANGENAMEYARQLGDSLHNSTLAALIAYDLQAGSYITNARQNPERARQWCAQLAEIIRPCLAGSGTLLEVGCGEATTLAGVLGELSGEASQAYGFDISWSRCAHGAQWLQQSKISAELFVADLFDIPLMDNSIDVVYTSHSIEPNGGREAEAISELYRVARRALVLIEPIYELGSTQAQARMQRHGYVRNLKQSAENLGLKILDYRLLDYSSNPLNPSGLLLIEKSSETFADDFSEPTWRCPLTRTELQKADQGYYSPETGIVYPILAGIPLLRTTHAVVASAFEKGFDTGGQN